MVLQGVIRPPPEIRAVADRTALYVAKNGRAFESRILGSEKGKTPKFAFLHETSPFHAYYEQRIQFYEQGGTDDAEPDAKPAKQEAKAEKDNEKKETESSEEPAAKAKVKATAITSVVDPIGKALLAQRNKIAAIRQQQQKQREGKLSADNEDSDRNALTESAAVVPPPPPLRFVTIVAPSSLSAQQLETMQLVAQFTAMDRQFLLQLSSREWNNPEFAFCLPRHPFFPYFSALVDAYRHVLASWTAPTDSAASSPSSAAVRELRSVERCLEVAAYRAEYERDAEQQRKSNQSAVDVAVLVDWHDFVVVETIDFPVDEVVELGMMPPPPPPMQRPASVATAAPAAAAGGDGMEESDDEEDDDDREQIRLVPNYQPRVVGNEAKEPQYVIDPITGKSVAVQDMPEHMRIQLLDPKWAEERKKFQDKQKDTNLVSGDVVASNLERLAQARGSSREHDLLSKESDSKKRLAEANRVIREQGQGSVGPSFPAPSPPLPQRPHDPPPVQHEFGGDPAAKRPRVDRITTVEAPPPPNAPPRVSAPPPGFETTIPLIDPTAAALDESFAGASSSTPSSAAQLLSEAEFAATLSQPEVTLQIRIPNDRTQMAWNFYGQIIPLPVNVMSTVKEVKQLLSKSHLNGMPANKIQLKSVATGAFLKDKATLAALNLGPGTSLELVPRARGGRK